MTLNLLDMVLKQHLLLGLEPGTAYPVTLKCGTQLTFNAIKVLKKVLSLRKP